MSNTWHPFSWEDKPHKQQAIYPSQRHLQQVIAELNHLPSLVSVFEIEKLKTQLAAAVTGDAFVLQGGDCAESFAHCTSDNIAATLKVLLQMSLVLLYGLRKPIIRIGRIAGQYAKPRSADTEIINDIELPTYRGDNINRPQFTSDSRTPNPNLLREGYNYSATTLNHIRSLVESGFADLNHHEYWNLDFGTHSPSAEEYQKLADKIEDVLDFIGTIPGANATDLHRVDFFTSHEALHLPYETALTRQATTHNKSWYNLSTHFPWIGMRTAEIDGAHVEYMRGIHNPLAVKVGPSMNTKWVVELAKKLNPMAEPGRLSFIHRMGVKKIEQALPTLIKAVQDSGIPVVWICDPMHGNTEVTQEGIKTRRFDNILSELQQAFAIHTDNQSHLGGVHFELTGDNVTECIGGARGLTERDLSRSYKSLVDPRLNYEQSLEMAMLIAKHNRS